ncbi:TetR/AcrR family transcriptional regulator [Amycolatopsis cihanbeyliensis]|uniref:TetR family transcriptional regulator n=1 Tax=Amycolatopsis cihanbeyliensis TaxID=1128664 RepID=A0A542DLL9_AMYCI|nr:TetR family transcriptional regulator [Amycolatopsis cihanbeyliensis]TQJ03986.1 TetR family transcriptional regulator [Amycolatopsis cihanbeyliensis]
MSDRQAAKATSATQPEANPLRRQPVQQRSAQRVERMLDASAELIEEMGYEALTTTLIAKRAGVAVGSLYQFFPDKRAVVQALTQRNLERFMAAVSERLDGVDHQHWWDIVDSLLDIYLQMHREVPGFSKVHFGDVVDQRLLDDRRDNNRVIADSLTGLLAARLDLPTESIALPIATAVETADGLLNLAFRRQPDGDPEVVAETKYLLKGYLASRLGD